MKVFTKIDCYERKPERNIYTKYIYYIQSTRILPLSIYMSILFHNWVLRTKVMYLKIIDSKFHFFQHNNRFNIFLCLICHPISKWTIHQCVVCNKWTNVKKNGEHNSTDRMYSCTVRLILISLNVPLPLLTVTLWIM